MNDKPGLLSVAEIDAIREFLPRMLSDNRAQVTTTELRSLLRMARAMAVQIERVAYTTHIVGEEWAVTVYNGHDGHARRHVTVGLVAAIEATEEP